MANEILLGPGALDGRMEVVFYYAVPSGQRILARDSAGSNTAANAVPTPSAMAPAWAQFTAAEIAALDAGEALFVAETLSQQVDEDDAAFIVRARAIRSGKESALLAEYMARFKHLNKRFSA